ncbi:MAG: alpha/beta hydrolase [Paraglaciecola sp.]|uniref:alpha/beta hydrolase n=1 Tax=Paraglaciecola sp. TaxID=1920173 RepID=UPI003297D8AD
MLSKEVLEKGNDALGEILLASQSCTNENVLDGAVKAKAGLDDDAKKVLDYIHSLPPVYNFEPEYTRRYRENPFEHDDVKGITKQDISIPCDGHELAARVYRPAINHGTNQETEHETAKPALIYFHGGGFVLGSIDSYDKMLSQLCLQSNLVVISVAYRLAPETVFPGAVEDTQEATDWIAKNATSLGLDLSRIAIGGDSAGANLATVYCHLNKHRQDFKAVLQLLIYPSILGNDSSPSRQEFTENLLLTKTLLKWFHDLYISTEQEKDPRFNVLQASDFTSVPPAFILTGGFDPLRDEGQMYADKLKQNGIAVKHSCYTDMFHGFINFGALQQAKDAVTECAFVLKTVMNIK